MKVGVPQVARLGTFAYSKGMDRKVYGTLAEGQR
jgi:hypothetical protein